MEKKPARLIFHIDVNSAFLSWEAVRRVRNGQEDLRLIPSAIGGDANDRRGVILAKSIPAKRYGVQTGEPVGMALRKCPQLVLVPPDFGLYMRNSRDFVEICKKYAPVVEQYSIDECFLDMSGTSLLYPDPVKVAYEIKDRIREELGFTVNVGIGPNKILAKMAGDFEKPDKVHTLFMEEIPDKMWPLPIGDLFTVGRATAGKLLRANIRTIGDLAKAEPAYIRSIVGEKQGESIWNFANGLDDSPVAEEAEAVKGYSNSTTCAVDVVTLEEADRLLVSLSDSTATRMRADGKKTGCVCVTIRSNDFKDESHQKKLREATDQTEEIYQTARMLLRELWDGRPLRLIGVALTSLTDEDAFQMSLFPNEKKEKSRKMDQTVDALRNRFGTGAIRRGSDLLNQSEVGKKHKAQIDMNHEN